MRPFNYGYALHTALDMRYTFNNKKNIDFGEKMKDTGLTTREYVNTVIKGRPRNIHKGDCGKVLVIAGSTGMAGAAVLCAKGTLRAGSGLVKILVPRDLFTIIQIGVPEATCVSRDVSLLDLGGFDAIAIGPGLGDDEKNQELIKTVLDNFQKTIVLDADGINGISRYGLLATLKNTKGNVILTPHYGEAVRLLSHCQVEGIESMNREEMAKALVENTNATCILKGENTLVATLEGKTYINTTGNPGMATGGSGDVLTGIIASLAGQGLKPEDAARAGVFAHGLAGDLCAEHLGETGMTSLDIATMVALAFKDIIGK